MSYYGLFPLKDIAYTQFFVKIAIIIAKICTFVFS